ncbi:putative entry exclusion protein TrbK-alt [Mesorhizobium jarvisii]|uniref:putative entry exclusion protein TrbK-alt n=1 Tax=Mesorhizobium jarvisii TaxID=1777867 RepID=UPI001F0A04AD|nr:putative entry exclusion protein TrbK-alt [Mesorhizobium jarvisii]MCH4559200.1 putative entry exclusion protein TrbK-alt [Mesorhizobium jarvisii]
MGGKTLARIAAVIFVAVAVTVTAIEMALKEGKPAGAALQAPTIPALDPLRADLRRCQVLGEAALRDSDCLRLWAEQRERFLRTASSASDPAILQSPDATAPEAR